MKKKTYLIPAIIITDVKLQTLMNASLTVDGDSGIGMGDGETPTTADSRRRDEWDDEEWDEEEEEW